MAKRKISLSFDEEMKLLMLVAPILVGLVFGVLFYIMCPSLWGGVLVGVGMGSWVFFRLFCVYKGY